MPKRPDPSTTIPPRFRCSSSFFPPPHPCAPLLLCPSAPLPDTYDRPGPPKTTSGPYQTTARRPPKTAYDHLRPAFQNKGRQPHGPWTLQSYGILENDLTLRSCRRFPALAPSVVRRARDRPGLQDRRHAGVRRGQLGAEADGLVLDLFSTVSLRAWRPDPYFSRTCERFPANERKM